MTLEELLKQATPLPWHGDHDGDPIQIGCGMGRFVAMTLPCESEGARLEDEANAVLIIHAVNMLPKLVGLLELLEAQRHRCFIPNDKELVGFDERMIALLTEAKEVAS